MISCKLAQAGLFDTAETIARSFAESHDRADALRVVARELARAKNERASEIFAAALDEARFLDEAIGVPSTCMKSHTV
jgi:hypothetical protein